MATDQLGTDVPNHIRRYQKRKERLEYYLAHDEQEFRKLMKELDCGYTGFLFPYERDKSSKFQRYRQFEMKSFEQREQEIDEIFSWLYKSKASLARSKRKLQQLSRQVEQQHEIALDPDIKEVETKEKMFKLYLMTFLKQHQKQCQTVDDALNRMLSSTSMMKNIQMMNEEMEKWVDKITRQNQKQPREAERLFLLAQNEKDSKIKFKLLSKIIRIGNYEQVIRGLFERMINCISDGKYLSAAHDFSILFSKIYEESNNYEFILNPKILSILFYYGIKCFYKLATDKYYEYLSKSSRYQHFQKYQQLVNILQLMSYFDFYQDSSTEMTKMSSVGPAQSNHHKSTGIHFYRKVLRKLKKEGIPYNPEMMDELKNKIETIILKNGQENNHKINNVDSIKKNFTYSNLFGLTELDPNGYYLHASRPIKKDQIIFYEKILAFSVKKFHWKKYCAYCSSRLNYNFFPCTSCSESVFCDIICERMAASTTRHGRTCGLSPACIQEHFKDHIIAMVYDLFSSLPIRLVIDVARVEKNRAYDHALKYPGKLPFTLAMFTSLMLTLPYPTMGKINLQEDYSKKIFYDSIRLSMIIAHKFRLTRIELRVIHGHDEKSLSWENELVQLEDLPRLIRVVFATIYQMKHSPIAYHDLLQQSYYYNKALVHNYWIKDIGRGFGAFSTRLHHVCKTEVNIQRIYRKNGEIVYKALVDIDQDEPLKLYNEIPECSGEERLQWFERFQLEPCKKCRWCRTIPSKIIIMKQY